SWCPGPDSNRYGVASEGFSYSLQLSLLSPLKRAAHLESGLSLCRVRARMRACEVRQGPSSLYTFRKRHALRGLARDCRHVETATWGCFPEFDPIHSAVSAPSAQL